MLTGTVKFFNETKGFGFIKNNETEQDVFVHISGLNNKNVLPKEGDQVSYDVEETQKGINAKNVSII